MSGRFSVGIMQPYFFPHLAHFALIAHTDAWVVFDITQYTPKTWMNRNRVLHPNGGPNWVTVPLANASISITSAQARVADMAGTARSVLGKLSHYRRKAPYYEAVVDLVSGAFALPAGDDSLVHLNLAGLRAVCRYLDLPFAPRICSELALDLPADLGPGDWALEIASRLGADAYVNPIGGRALFVLCGTRPSAGVPGPAPAALPDRPVGIGARPVDHRRLDVERARELARLLARQCTPRSRLVRGLQRRDQDRDRGAAHRVKQKKGSRTLQPRACASSSPSTSVCVRRSPLKPAARTRSAMSAPNKRTWSS